MFGGQNSEFQYFGGFSEKLIILGHEGFVGGGVWDHHKIGLYLGAISMHFRVFS